MGAEGVSDTAGASDRAGNDTHGAAVSAALARTMDGGSMTDVAAKFWDTKQVSSLAPLQSVLMTATNHYNSLLTIAAQAKVSAIRNALQNAADARDGNVGLPTGMTKLADLGWTQAGAYYLEFARLNGQTLSLMNATPVVNPPSWVGLSKSLAKDVAPLATSATAFITRMMSYVQTTDGLDVAAGNADLFDGAMAGGDGAGIMEQTFRGLHLNEALIGFRGGDGSITQPGRR